jgi:hypothetical protein
MSWKTCGIVRLRAHHLLCILTFAGKGYSPAFVANMAGLVARIGAGEPIEVVAGPDDICAPLEGSDDIHCHEPSVLMRDGEASRALALPGMRPLVLDRAAIAALREQFAAGAIRGACAGCSWFGLCTEIASAGYPVASL